MTRTNNNDGLLPLPQLAPDFSFGGTSGLMVVNADPAPRSAIRGIRREIERHEEGMRGYVHKEWVSGELMGEMARHGLDGFISLAQYIASINQEAKGTEYEPQVRQFSRYVLEMYGQHVAGMNKLVSRTLADIVISPVFPPEPEEQRGFLKRLFGGKTG